MYCPRCSPCICTCNPEAVSSSFFDPDAPYCTDGDAPFRTDDDFDPDACNDPDARKHIAQLMGIPR